MRRHACRVQPGDRERGAVLVLTTLLLTSLLGVVAIIVDLGALRGDVRVDQSIADFAALAAGQGLAANDPVAGCKAAVTYINMNAHLSTAINSTTFCSGMGTTVCSGGAGQATPSTTVGAFTVSVRYPVPDSEIADPNLVGGSRPNDGTQCQRMRVVIRSSQRSLFGGIFGASTVSGTRTATARPWPIGEQHTPALWLLDPKGCTSLAVSGGSQLTVGTSTVQGVLTVDSDGSTCQAGQHTISSQGSGTLLQAMPTTGTTKGVIQLFGLPLTATTCIASGTGQSACDPVDVSSGRLAPQPIPVASRATRSRVDDVFNCHNPYPSASAAYHGITLVSSCNPTTTPPYIDNLKAAIGTSGLPAVVPSGIGTTYQRWKASFSCNPPGTISVSGNWWIDCPGGLSIGNGTSVEFKDGNVVFDNGFSMTGGTLKFNTNNTNAALPTISCMPPGVTTPCTGYASPGASFVYLRDGDINITGGVLTVNHAMVYSGSGYVKVNSSPPTWVAPTEGPFSYLALWSDMPATSNSTSKFSMAGGTGVQLAGIFFTPEAAPFTLSGGGTWGQQNAQFISFQVQVTGGGVLTIAPDAAKSVKTPTLAGSLIR
jgi:Flp pilus assembly protein TadG